MTDNLNQLAIEAQNGSKEALEALIGYAQGYIYNLALRMLQVPMDAEDATQEILIKLVTHVGQFRGESAFSTWMYRIASNHLLTMQTRDRDRQRLSFEGLSLRLEESLAVYEATTEETYENTELVEEVKRSCTLGMLMCLDREDRMALMLGELIDVSSDEGAYIMDISASAYRKRLSRARQAIVTFVTGQCGIVNPANPCRCHKHVRNKIQVGSLNPHQLVYAQAHDANSTVEVARSQQADLDDICRTTALLRSHPVYAHRTDFVETLKHMFHASDEDQ